MDGWMAGWWYDMNNKFDSKNLTIKKMKKGLTFSGTHRQTDKFEFLNFLFLHKHESNTHLSHYNHWGIG